MIKFSLALRNPVWRDSYQDLFRSYYDRTWQIARNKSLEIDITRHCYNLLEIHLDTVWWGHDHAGPRLEIGILGFGIRLEIYDHRHWDEDRDIWLGI
jgi:hypothetical protein